MDDNTRDIAMQASIKIDQHMTDCTKFRDGLREDLRGFSDDLKKLNNRVMIIIGGLTLLSHSIEAALSWMHK